MLSNAAGQKHLFGVTLQDYVVRSTWADAASFEAWASSKAGSAQLEALPDDVRQYAPKAKDGVPEQYMPFRAGPPPPDPEGQL